MLLLDRNNEPTSTVYYIAAALDNYIDRHPGLDAGQLYAVTANTLVNKEISYSFFVMALDFLFLLNRVSIDEKGGLHVHQVA